MNKCKTIGIDLAKNTFYLTVLDKNGRLIERKKFNRQHISQIEHSRHRSLHGFMLNLLGGLIAYCLKPEKPSLNITSTEKTGLMAMA